MSMSTTTGTAAGGETPGQAFAAMELADEPKEITEAQEQAMIVDGSLDIHESPIAMTASPVATITDTMLNATGDAVITQRYSSSASLDIPDFRQVAGEEVRGEEAQAQKELLGAGSERDEPEIQKREEHKGPPRVIIIEELDTPATRREKNMRKKAEKARLAAEAAAASRSVQDEAQELEGTHSGAGAHMSADVSMDVDELKSDAEMESQSELTSLSSIHGDNYDEDAETEDAETEDDHGVMSGPLTPIDVLTEAGETDIGADGEPTSAPTADSGTNVSGSASRHAKQSMKSKRRTRRDTERGKLKFPKGRRFLEGGTLGAYLPPHEGSTLIIARLCTVFRV